MKGRWIGAAALLLAFLMAVDHWSQARTREHRTEVGTVRILVPRDPALRILDVAWRDRRWRYVLDDGQWRYPAYHDAFVPRERMRMLLRAVQGCTGTPVDPGTEGSATKGLQSTSRLQLTLRDLEGRALASVQAGDPVPGTAGREVFLRVGSAGTVYHAHADPWVAVGRPPRALIDPHFLAGNLQVAGAVACGLMDSSQGRDDVLRRMRALHPSPATGTPLYRWTLDTGTERQECVTASVEAYLDFLSRLRFLELCDPGAFEPGPRRVWLRDGEGRADTVQIGRTAAAGGVFVRRASTRQVARLSAAAAALLVPARETLTDSLPDPSPYQKALAADRSARSRASARAGFSPATGAASVPAGRRRVAPGSSGRGVRGAAGNAPSSGREGR